MPCFLVVTILLKDYSTVKKAASELGLVEGKDFTYDKGKVTLEDPAKEGPLKQRYGVIQAEREARRRGYKAQRNTQKDGSIQLVLLR